MLDSNSVNNSVITYYPEIDTTGGASNQLRNFRVPGAACNVAPSNTTDQCFVDAGVTGVATFVAGTEDFGLQVACVEDMGTSTTGLSTVPVAYSNTDASVASSATCQTTDAGVKFYWDVTGTPSQIATGTGYVDNEAVKIRYGATAAATTPGGSYSVTTTFVATPAF